MIPPQTPVTPPRYRFRLRGDTYRVPVGRVSEPREYVQPTDDGTWQDYRDHPRNESLWARFRRAWSE